MNKLRSTLVLVILITMAALTITVSAQEIPDGLEDFCESQEAGSIVRHKESGSEWVCAENGVEPYSAFEVVDESEFEVIDDDGNTDFFTVVGLPSNVEPDKIAGMRNEQECTLPGGCNVIGDPGVLGCDLLADANANDSCIWTGGANHYIVENEDASINLPGYGYVTMFSTSLHLQAKIDGDDFEIDFPPCGKSCAWGFVIRGFTNGEHLTLSLSDYGDAGSAIVTRYPVGENNGGFFSQNYIVAQAENALQRDNCDGDGCDSFYLAVLDVNDLSLSILSTEDTENWILEFTNVAD